MPPSVDDRLGPYQVLSKLGEGGMGVVYRARDTRVGRDVAVKVSAEHFNFIIQTDQTSSRDVTKVAAYQAPLLPSGSMDAIGLIAAQVRTCESIGVEFLCCPEVVLGGLADYASRPFEIAIDVQHGQLQRALAPVASKTVTTIVGFTEIVDDGRLFNAAAVVHNGVVLGLYRKLHPAINSSIYAPGDATPVFTVGNLTFGIVICRDSIYGEPAQAMAARGATVLFVPTNNGMPPTKGGAEIVRHARHTDVTTARKHGMTVVRADVTGQTDGLVSYGSSGIVDRVGAVVQAAKEFEVGLIVADIETAAGRGSCSDRVGNASRFISAPITQRHTRPGKDPKTLPSATPHTDRGR